MTSYKPLTPVRFADLFDGRLERFGVTESVRKGTTDTDRCLTDGNNYLWAFGDADGPAHFTRWAPNGAPGRILSAVEEAFDTRIVSEYQPQYWGFETEEEWDRWQTEIMAEDDMLFYEQVMKYIRGEQNDIESGTVGANWAQKAKVLIADNPELALPENKTQLLEEARADTGITLVLDERDAADIMMRVTHEDDLPQA